jgi:plasmid stabilization system protein ParE
MRPYDLAEPARLDLFGIKQYLKVAPRSSQARIISGLRAGFRRAADFPYTGRSEPEFWSEAGGEIRCIVVRPYQIFYRVEILPINIVAILHGAQDIPSILGERLLSLP